MKLQMIVYLLVFWAMQAIAQMLFKWGSVSGVRWLWGFLGGNFFGLSSIWLLMLMYRIINPNVALGVALGGGFLLSQLALVLVFKSKVAPVQWIGIAAIIAGIAVLAIGSPESGMITENKL